jgi:nucleotide-binding universal stress UspA family protein
MGSKNMAQWEIGMSYETIMVNLSLDQPNDVRIAVALDLADRFNARIIGIAATDLSPPLYFTTGEAAEQLVSEGQASLAHKLSDLETLFRQAAGSRSDRSEWRCSREMPVRYVAREARAADILVTGQGRGSGLSDPFAQADLRDLVMQVGRPILVVPHDVVWLHLKSCLVAWKDTREARRAVVDSLPMLRQANEVTVLEVVEAGSDKSMALRRVRDVVSWLECHGIAASPLVSEEEGDATAQIEVVASRIDAGLVIAGAYGHTRFREWVFGGVTRRLMDATDRCTLFSH